MLLCRRTDLSSESIIFYHRFPSRTHKKLSSKCSLIFQNLKMDRFVLFFVLLTLSPGRGQVISTSNFFCLFQYKIKIIFIRFRGAGDLSQKVQMKLFCYWDILFLIISNIFYACRSLSSRRRTLRCLPREAWRRS